jgi:hypothetical protein
LTAESQAALIDFNSAYQRLGTIAFLRKDPGDDLLDGFIYPLRHQQEAALELRIIDL